MLDELERKLTALVGDATSTRPALAVVQATGELPAPDAGTGVARVGIASLAPEPVFAEEGVLLTNGDGPAPASRRVLPVGFTATISFERRATAAGASALVDARTSMLADASLVAHALAATGFATGAAFETAAPDPGFAVRSFGLATGVFDPPPAGDLVAGSLGYAGTAVVWPPGVAEPEGRVAAVDSIIAALPLAIVPDDPVVSAGGATTVRIRGTSGRRLVDPATGARTDLRLAVTVVSDLPLAERGAIASGDAGTEEGSRLVTATGPETAVAYQAPTGDIGTTRSELIAVRLARPDRSPGTPLASSAILLAPGSP
jgi:hypothetical protein